MVTAFLYESGQSFGLVVSEGTLCSCRSGLLLDGQLISLLQVLFVHGLPTIVVGGPVGDH